MVRKGEVENFRPMIAQQAWATWRKLPSHTRAWIGIDDMIADGIWFVMFSAFKRYDPQRAGKLSTFVYHVVTTFFDEYYVNHHYAQMRRDDKTVSVEALQQRYKQKNGGSIGIDEALLAAGAPIQTEPEWCGAVDAILKVYQMSSEPLRDEIIRWFIRTEGTKFHNHGRKFVQAKREFTLLAEANDLDIHGCRHLLRNPICLDKMSRGILLVPYDVNNPTPDLRGHDTAWPLKVMDRKSQAWKQISRELVIQELRNCQRREARM